MYVVVFKNVYEMIDCLECFFCCLVDNCKNYI